MPGGPGCQLYGYDYSDGKRQVNERVELENHIETAKQATINIQGIREACELVKKNLTELSFENKRIAFEALNIKIWIDGENIRIERVIPITKGVIATTQLLQHLSLAHPLSL